jgi:hypothetical protein
LRIDGEVFLGDPRERDTDAAPAPGDITSAAHALRRAALNRCRIEPPRPYLAALAFDGDEMGKWLSGAKSLTLEDYITREALAAIREKYGDSPRLKRPWPMTPALHAVLSEACSVFSQHSAPRTLHADGLPGFLIYAGGDDVLALTSIGCGPQFEWATEAALRLRLRFSGHVRRECGADTVDPSSPAGFVVDPSQGLQMALGTKATASAALVVFHHKWPMGRAIVQAREALDKYAKDFLGRNALAIVILRRSGQITLTGLKFLDRQGGTPVRALQRLARAFAFDELSPRFLSEVARRLRLLEGGLAGEQLKELAEPIIDEALRSHLTTDADGISEIEDAVRHLGRSAADAFAGVDQPEGDADIPRDRRELQRWLDLIEAAAFLGRGVEP